jgi:1-acyl-sn-glycerol-3-phosphate acyltransferase
MYDSKRVVINNDQINFKRKEPFVLLSNHTFMLDVVHVPFLFRNVPAIVASQDLMIKPYMNFLLTWVAKCIPKSKGKSDFRTVKSILSYIKKGYPILIFPEGDSTFYGETGYIEYSTAKLIKKLGIDVITCRHSGGHLSNPRWATSTRMNRKIHLDYKLKISKNDLNNLTVDEIYSILVNELYVNDYEEQRTLKEKHPSKKSAEGLENILYVCPECHSVNTIVTSKNHIRCTKCNVEGYIDQYGFINGFRFDNTVEWDAFQKNYNKELRELEFTTLGTAYINDYNKFVQAKIGNVIVTYKNNSLIIDGALSKIIPVEELNDVIITMRSNLNFVYEDTHYFIIMKSKSAHFLRALQDKY